MASDDNIPVGSSELTAEARLPIDCLIDQLADCWPRFAEEARTGAVRGKLLALFGHLPFGVVTEAVRRHYEGTDATRPKLSMIQALAAEITPAEDDDFDWSRFGGCECGHRRGQHPEDGPCLICHCGQYAPLDPKGEKARRAYQHWLNAARVRSARAVHAKALKNLGDEEVLRLLQTTDDTRRQQAARRRLMEADLEHEDIPALLHALFPQSGPDGRNHWPQSWTGLSDAELTARCFAWRENEERARAQEQTMLAMKLEHSRVNEAEPDEAEIPF